MTKHEKIQEAWIEMQSHIESEGVPKYNEEGWAKYGGLQKSEYFKTMEHKEWLGYHFYRPKSLEGIENNNGWKKLENREDLPKESGQYLTRRSNGIIISEHFYNNKLSWYLWKECYFITHYQDIIKPKPPIY